MRPTVLTGRDLDVQVAQTYGELSQKAADIITAALKEKPGLILCASAGGTPTGLYQCLASMHLRQPRLFSRLRVLQIDEWGGLPCGHAASCDADLRTKLLNPLRITPDRFVGFKTDAAQPELECERISGWLGAHGPIDICILGLGANGHIAMNEPGEALWPRVHVSRLAKSSQNHGMLTDLEAKPKFGFTLGMADILRSRKVLLLVSGAHKAKVLKRFLEGQVSTAFPASFLWLHPNAVVLCDAEAMGRKPKTPAAQM